jgi:hypothetical protein
MEEVFQAPQVAAGRGSETMLAPQEVQRMLALSALGWGGKRISRELGSSPHKNAFWQAVEELIRDPARDEGGLLSALVRGDLPRGVLWRSVSATGRR